MRPDDTNALDELERDHQLWDLIRRTRRAIATGRLDSADQYAAQAAQLAPDTTTAEELLGDVALAKGQFVAARDHFHRAMEIEPSNADAEDKYGAAILRIGSVSHLRERITDAVENPDQYRGFRHNPVSAAVYSIVPGLGQLYNHEYEKGLVMAGSAMLLLAWILSKLLSYSGASLVAEARNPRFETETARQVVEAYGPFMWTLIVLAIVAYVAILVYSIVDAYRVCARQAKEADELGVGA